MTEQRLEAATAPTAGTVRDDSNDPLSEAFWKDKNAVFPDMGERPSRETPATKEQGEQPQAPHDVKTQGMRVHHTPTGRDIIIHTERTVQLTPEQLKRFAERGRMLMLDAKTQEPITTYEGIPLPTNLQEVIAKRSAYLDKKYDEAAPSFSLSPPEPKPTSVTESSAAAGVAASTEQQQACEEEEHLQACVDEDDTDEDEEFEEDEEDEEENEEVEE